MNRREEVDFVLATSCGSAGGIILMTDATSLKRRSPPDDSAPPAKQRLCEPFTLDTDSIVTTQGWARVIVSINPLGGLLEGADANTFIKSKPFKTGDGKEWEIIVCPFSQGNPQIGIYFRLLTPLPPEIRQTVNYTLEVFTKSADGKLARDVHYYHNKITFSADNSQYGYPSALPHCRYRSKFSNACFIDLIMKPTTSSKESKQRTNCVGLVNEGTTCYLNSLLQTFYMITEFRRAVYLMPTEKADQDSIPLALQRVFYHLQHEEDAVSTKELLESFGWGVDEFNTQHDVQEFNCTLSARLERKMKGTAVEGTFSRLFEGVMVNFIKCENVDYESRREEKFLDLQLNVKGLKSLEEAFEKYVEPELLIGENQYDAESFGKQDAKKGVTFLKFPPVLQLQLKRFEYNYLTDSMHKVNDNFTFSTHLDLNRYTESPGSFHYTLFSILIHTGSANAGHYFAFIRPDCDHYYKFDDEVVESALEEYAFLSSFGGEVRQLSIDEVAEAVKITLHRNDMSAYMLVYVQDSMAEEVLKRPIRREDIPERLHLLFAEEKEEKERLKQTEILQTQMCTLYLVSFQMVKGFNRPGIITSDSEQFADNPFRYDAQKRLKISVPKTLKVLELKQQWKKKYNLGFLRLWTFNPGYRNWEFKEAKDEDDAGAALCAAEGAPTRAVYIDVGKDVQFFKKLDSSDSSGEYWTFNEGLSQAPPQEPKVETGYMLRSQESIPVFLKWFFCDESGPHIRLISVISVTASMTMNQARALILKEEQRELEGAKVNLYIEKSAGEPRGKNVRLYTPDIDHEMSTKLQQPLGLKYIKLDPGDALIGEIQPTSADASYVDAKSHLEAMQEIVRLSAYHKDKHYRAMTISFGRKFMETYYKDSKFQMDFKLGWTVRETMEEIANEFKEFDPTISWDQVQLYSNDEYKRTMVETPFPLPEENSISPRSKKPLTLSQFISEPNILYFDLLEFPIPRLNSGLLAQVLYLDHSHAVRTQINAVVGLQASVHDLRKQIWPQLLQAMQSDPTLPSHHSSCKAYLLQAHMHHYICEMDDLTRLEEILPHARFQVCFRTDSVVEQTMRENSDYEQVMCFHNENDARRPFFIYVSVIFTQTQQSCADVCRQLKGLAPAGVKVKIYSYVMQRDDDRSCDLVKNTVVEESEEKYLEKYSNRLQLSIEYPKTCRGELWMKDA